MQKNTFLLVLSFLLNIQEMHFKINLLMSAAWRGTPSDKLKDQVLRVA